VKNNFEDTANKSRFFVFAYAFVYTYSQASQASHTKLFVCVTSPFSIETFFDRTA